jgi:hypothetical protein
MMLPAKLTVHNFWYALDGGTTILQTTDEAGQNHSVMLVQHAFPNANPSLRAIPGRLYFDGELVPMRSELEAGLLAILRTAEIQYSEPFSEQGRISPKTLILGNGIREVFSRSHEDNIRALLAELIQFVESEAYLRFVERVEQAADPTMYTLWPAWEPTTRKQVVVRLGRVLGIGLPAACHFLDSGAPLAECVTALEVAELGRRYSAEGLVLRVEPEFRWPISLR